MRVRSLRVRAYGSISGRSLENLPGGLVIMLGGNEAGKSTLFSLLSTLLYGFYPLKDFPYKPWGAEACPEFKSELALEGGGVAEVSRKLMSAPGGVLNWNGSVQNLGNRTLPFASHVGRELYNALYALTQATLRSLDEAQRAEIEDRLLLGLSPEILRPARDAAKQLEDQASALWRPNRRGNQEYRRLEQDRLEARRKREEARRADESVREKASRLDAINKRIEKLLGEKAELGADVRRADELLPLKKRLDQIEKWRSLVGRPRDVDRLPERLPAVHERLALNLEEARADFAGLKEERERLVEKKKILTPEDTRALERAGEIDCWVRKISAHEREKSAAAELARDEERHAAAIREAAGTMFSVPWNDNLLDAVDSVVLPDLKAGITAFQEKRREADTRAAEAMASADVWAGSTPPAWVPACAAVAGLALFASGLLLSSETMVAVAVFLALAAAFSFHQRSQQRILRERKKSDAAGRAGLQRLAGEECDAARRAVSGALGELPVAEALLGNPDLSLYQGIEKLCLLSAEYRKLRGQRRAHEERWRLQQENLADLMSGLGLEGASPEELGRAERRLAAAREHERLYKEADERLKQVDKAIPAAELKLNKNREMLSRFRDGLRRAAGEDLPGNELLAEAEKLQHLAGRIREAREELEREYPSLAELEAEIRHIETANEDAWSFDPVEIEKRRGRLNEIHRELEDLREEKGRLETEINASSGRVSAGEIDGEIARIEEEMEEAARRRDRFMLLACLLREADRRFRGKHQPDVLKRAGDYLRTITGGRYETITTMACEEGADRLVVVDGGGDILPVEFPLSGGTLDQIFLAFRLAVIDRLDEGHEALPLLMDEALVNWDDARLGKFDEILRQTAARRQIFFFTCHGWMAGRLADITGARVCEV